MKVTKPLVFNPTSLDDFVIGDDQTEQTLAWIADATVSFPGSGKTGMLLYGPPGTGKSSLAQFLPTLLERRYDSQAAQVYWNKVTCQRHTTAPQLRDQFASAQTVPWGRHHYFVLDEVDQLTGPVQAELKVIMEMPQCIFILATNHLHAINEAILSRSHVLPMTAAPAEKWLPLARRFFADNGISGVDEALLIKHIACRNGDVRDIAALLNRTVAQVGAGAQQIGSGR